MNGAKLIEFGLSAFKGRTCRLDSAMPLKVFGWRDQLQINVKQLRPSTGCIGRQSLCPKECQPSGIAEKLFGRGGRTVIGRPALEFVEPNPKLISFAGNMS